MSNNLLVHDKSPFCALVCLAAAIGVLLVAGCAGGGGKNSDNSGAAASPVLNTAATTSSGTSEGRGRVAITITWPDDPATTNGSKSRTIPQEALSLYLELTRRSNGEKRSLIVLKRFQEKIVTTGFEELLPTGDYVLACAARLNNNGTGATLAVGATVVTVTSGKTANATVELKGTAKAQPANADQIIAYTSSDNSGAFQFVPKFFERDGTPAPAVTLDPRGYAYSTYMVDGVTFSLSGVQYSVVGGGAFGSVTPGGVFTPIAPGTTRIRAEDIYNGVFGEWDVRVSSVKTLVFANGTGGRINTGSSAQVTVAGGTDASDQPLNLTRVAPLLHFSVVSGGGTVNRFGDTTRPSAFFIAPTTPGDSRVRVDVPGTPAAAETVFSSVGIQSIQLTPSGPILLNKPGDTVQLTYVVTGSDGQPVPQFRYLTAQSVDNTIATADNSVVNSGGNTITITARNYGQTLVHIASADDPTKAIDVPVNVGTGKVNVGVH